MSNAVSGFVGSQLAAAIVGSVIGAIAAPAVTFYLSQADPELQSVDIDIRPTDYLADVQNLLSPQQNDMIVVDAQWRQTSLENQWIPGYERTMPVGDYLRRLSEHADTLKSIADDCEGLSQALDSWPKTIIPGDRIVGKQIFDTIWEHAALVTGHLAGEYRRRGELFKSPEPEYGREPTFSVLGDKDGDFYVQDHIQTLPLVWTTRTRAGRYPGMEDMFRRVANAIGYVEPSELQYLKASLDELVRQGRGAAVALVEARRQLTYHSRWTVNVVVANTGGRPVSVAPFATLRVPTEGFQVDEDGHTRSMVKDSEIRFVRSTPAHVTYAERDSDGDVTTAEVEAGLNLMREPMVLGAGESKLITLVSSDRIIGASSDHKGLVEAWERCSLRAELVLLLGRGTDAESQLSFPDIPFCSAEHGPPNETLAI